MREEMDVLFLRLKETNLGDFGVLEALLLGDGVPVNVCPVASVLHNGEEEHGLRGCRLWSLGWGFVGHGLVF